MPNKLITDLPLAAADTTSVAPISNAAGTVTSKVTLASIAALGGGAPADNTVSTAKIVNNAVTYAKLQNVSATDRLLGRSSAGAGVVEEVPCTAFGRSVLATADAAGGRAALAAAPTAAPVFSGNVGIGTSSPAAVLDVNGSAAVSSLLIRTSLSGAVPVSIAEGRLSIASSTPEPAGDLTAQATLYYTAARGNKIMLYDTSASSWRLYSFFNITFSLAGLPANTNYDVFVYDNAGTLALSLTQWTNDTTRVAIVRLDGVLVSGSNSSYRYVGTIRTSAVGQCSDSATQRFVWNMDNRIPRRMFFNDTVLHTWAPANNALRPWRNVTTLGLTRVEFVTGERGNGSLINLPITATLWTGANAQLGFDSTTTGTAGVGVANTATGTAATIGAAQNFYAPAGYHYLQALQGGVSGLTSNYSAVAGSPTLWG